MHLFNTKDIPEKIPSLLIAQRIIYKNKQNICIEHISIIDKHKKKIHLCDSLSEPFDSLSGVRLGLLHAYKPSS